ncbi:MBL fold metallo-hydrolase [Wenyingzhuangia sp. 2_MG-2023]|uniref:MBL fold metallo-hydrolase n=1 Tax=Wenyingzhuangia sp. 2_MG-2023 TaxID=3062639 RepID=UPI0026E3EC16|nr:MBL fold metallo-hydrolase [Wenyingzhuangia sp. 2_MG-2023]MDO6737381.1 MBL fold metallo-hydrolase [Wenyingzhuangia sp. 2_MG-2023]
MSILPSLNGDSIFIKIDDYTMLIDGGYVDTFNNFIKPELLNLSSLDLSLNHLVVTHIDGDHISGIIKLLKENNSTSFIQIENIWHNSFKHIKEFNPNIKFKGKSVKELQVNYNLKEEQTETTKDISSVQGSTLASILFENKYNWNAEFNGKAISIDIKTTIKLTDEITLKLLSPSNEKLSTLNKDWKKELYQKGYSTTEDLEGFSEIAFESLVALQKEQKLLKKKNISTTGLNIDELAKSTFYEDDRSANGSSIAFVIEYKKKKLLFLADSHPSIIINSLKSHYNEEDFPIYFDLIKVSHHGSQNNTNLELLKMITSQKYIFSTNGKTHNHPDKETIARIIHQKTTNVKELFFTYPLESIEAFKNDELKQKYNYQITEMNGSKPIKFDL